MKSLEFNKAKLPIWVHLKNMPLELFTKNEFSYIASALGNPLCTNKITANHRHLAYAKICVKIDAPLDIPIPLRLRDGFRVPIKF